MVTLFNTMENEWQWSQAGEFVRCLGAHSLYIQNRKKWLLREKKTHLDAKETPNSHQNNAKGQKRFPFSCCYIAVFGSIQQGVHRVKQCSVFQHSSTRYAHCAVSICDLFKFGSPSAFFTGRAASRRLTALPALPFWLHQLGSGRIVAGDALCVPLGGSGDVRVLEVDWNAGRNVDILEGWRQIAKCMMVKGEAHYESFILGCEAADAEIRLYRKTYFIKRLSHSDRWHLPFYGPDRNLNITL